jgi:aminoglycoside/choline kinase family phosphotransferase
METFQLSAPWTREEPLVGDASTRRYSRLTGSKGGSAILVRYPRDVASQIERDLETRLWCERLGLRVPGLIDHPPDAAWAVVEDFGRDDAEASLKSASAENRVSIAKQLTEPIIALSGVPPSSLPPWNPPLDRARLRWELAGFELWYLSHRNGVRPPASVIGWLDHLAVDIDRHPKRVCHRDYHLNNLFLLEGGEVGVIDFQDILVGPDTYDIVSILYERSLPDLLGEPDRLQVMEHWAAATSADDGWRHRARMVRLQRALKVLGAFARFEAAGSRNYVSWMTALAREVAPELKAVGAPPDLTGLLLDC